MNDIAYMRRALSLARRGYGMTSPNPMVGAVLVKNGRVIGEGYHCRAGGPHAEVEAISNATARKLSPHGSTLYVTLEPCSTAGRTPPCTGAILRAGIRKVVAAATDPNPRHSGRGLKLLAESGVEILSGFMAEPAAELNAAFNYWIVHKRPFVILKGAASLDGKIATRTGASKWITGEKSRAVGMHLRKGADAILVGINTVLADDPSLTFRGARGELPKARPLRRIVLDTRARIPLQATVLNDSDRMLTSIVVGENAPRARVERLKKRANVIVAPEVQSRINLGWLMSQLGGEEVTNLLVEGGGETHFSFLHAGLAHRCVFFYAPLVLGGAEAPKLVSGPGFTNTNALSITHIRWRKMKTDLMMTGQIKYA